MKVSSPTQSVPAQRTSVDGVLSVGVEEEFVLVDSATGHLVNRAADVLEDADQCLQPEIAQFQVESVSGVCMGMTELHDELTAARRTLSERAARYGAALVAAGTPVLGMTTPTPLTSSARYHRMSQEMGALTNDMAICGCHVHVGLPDDESKVVVSNHMRPWLPALLALTANSPYWTDGDTGYASWRYMVWSRWPSAGPPPLFESAAEYFAARDEIVASGAAMDRGMLYWDARLSARHPTLELRVCDVAATVEEAVLIAALVRGIASTALTSPVDAIPVPQHLLRVAMWRAARDGLEGFGLDPMTGAPTPAPTVVASLVRAIRPALELAGDYELVSDGVDRLLLHGSGAARQRRVFARRGRLDDVVKFLAAQTIE
ncbi:putative glutamate--cysteine ligase 2 [Lentzea sp. NBRC 105346]|uniref:carboxylate-amine ligase n=1 Tax=Lentzea sp. NBRC 105346 TaxID=3032205 RepID=UPI0024A2ECB7|nr:glutamate--cysteine ligase [Lentzea sp. NBRC 105346]GLZ28713.1 putative glutamate--cysteine ligase 2 [Lentzea sp. NBRC 105346]